MKYKDVIKNKIMELIDGYPDPCKPLILKHFKEAFEAVDYMSQYIDELLEFNSSLRNKYDKLQDQYIKLQVKSEFNKNKRSK